MTAPNERSVSPEAAIELAEAYFASDGLAYSVRSLGGNIKTSECRITDRLGSVHIGRGKGLGAQSTASAIFEAIEHFHYHTEPPERFEPARRLDLAGSDRRLYNGAPDWKIVCAGRPIPLTRLRFAALTGEEEDLLFPAILSNPRFVSGITEEAAAIKAFRLARYGTNSGTASGTTEAEAVLHGLLEVIERDAIGTELLQTVVRRSPRAVRQFDADSLPKNLAKLIELARCETGCEVVVWNITNDLLVPAALCSIQGEGNGHQRLYFGSGASVCPEYAIERAILEAVQTYQINRLYGIPLPASHLISPDTATIFQRCYFDAGQFGFRGGSTPASHEDMVRPIPKPALLSPQDQVRSVVKLLKDRGHTPYSRAVFRGPIHVSQVVVPTLERFHLSTYGIPVLPGARGRAILEGL